MVAGLIVASCATVGDDDRQHRSCFSEGIHHILAIEGVVAGELISFVERRGQVPRRRRGIWGGMAVCVFVCLFKSITVPNVPQSSVQQL